MRFIKLLATASVIGSPVRTHAEEQPRVWGLDASAADWVGRAPAQIEKIEAPFAMPPLDRPVFRDQVFNIADHGAQGDGITKNTEAFRKAIAACSAAGGGKVLVPKGKWHTGAIHLKSNVNLHMEAGAEIHFSDDPADYLPVVFQRWAGLEVMNYSPLIYALDCENIAVTGPGTLFGHGRRWQSWFQSEIGPKGSMWRINHDLVSKNIPVEQRVFGITGGAFGDPRHPGLRPSFIQPVRCRNVLLEGFTIQGYGPFWTIHPTYCENVIIRGVRVHTQGGHNADGIDLDSTRNVLVEYCYLDTGDDAIVVHTGTNAEGRRIGMPTENVVVRHIMVLGGHGGMVIGSLTSGGVRSILVHDCTYDGTDRGIRLKSNKSRGGVVENLWYRDITMRGIGREAIVIETDYKAAMPAGTDQTDYPTFRNITIENVSCDGAQAAASLMGTAQVPIENVVMRDVSIRAAKGMHFRSVRGLKLTNVNVKALDGIPKTFDNCEEVHQNHAAAGEEPAALADPTIDTVTPRYDYFASASVPYGMVSLHPDTKHGGLWNAGYRWEDKRILSFSHIHMTQTAGVPVMPAVGPCRGHLGMEANSQSFSHDEETVRLGYHNVKLRDSGIEVELTATCRVGMHRYTFPACEEAHLLFDVTAVMGPAAMRDGFVRRLSSTRLAGYSVMAPTFRRPKPCTVYFVADFQTPFDDFAGWRPSAAGQGNELAFPPQGEIAGAGVGAYVTYRHLTVGRQILLKVATSFVSIENAAMNLERELPGWDFAAVADAARREWNDYLGRIEVAGGTREQRVKFYTDLMHTAIGRRIYNDVDGSYMDNEGAAPQVRRIPLDANGKPHWQFLDMDCLWGTQWNLNLLWTMLYPEHGNWVAQTFLQHYRHHGTLGRASWGGQECYTMIGDSALPLLAALAGNGRADFDIEEAYAAGRKNAFSGGIRDRAGYEHNSAIGGGVNWYLKLGYVPVEIEGVLPKGEGYHRGGSGMTLEYAYQDWCLARMAGQLGKDDDVELFSRRGDNWRNVFDPSVGWARPRHENGEWVSPFQPVQLEKAGTPRGFVEASPATATFYVPQNIAGLIEAMGGREAFVKRLDFCFEESRRDRFANPRPNVYNYVDFSNEPSLHLAHLFSHAGEPWRTQYWTRQVKDVAFGGSTPQSGYGGDEDQGQLGAYGVLVAMGLFDIHGGVGTDAHIEITAPIFDRIRLHVPVNGDGSTTNTFEIVARRDEAAKDLYIQSATLDGKDWNSFEFPLRRLLDGGRLELRVGAEPNPDWGCAQMNDAQPAALDSR